jgi:hypothetical protein
MLPPYFEILVGERKQNLGEKKNFLGIFELKGWSRSRSTGAANVPESEYWSGVGLK